MNAESSPRPVPTVAVGPQVNVPPSLEQIPVDRLQVDAAYQRAIDSDTSRRIINSMVKCWDWSLCQPLVVARREDGGLYILDGQHRHRGAIERGDIPFLPCVVLSRLDHAGEASTFVKLNTHRQKLSEAEVFNGMLAAGDAEAKAVQQLLEDSGWRMARSSNTANWKPGDLFCAPMLARRMKRGGTDDIRFALDVLRAAYPEKPVTNSSSLLKALFEVYYDMQVRPGAVSVAALIAAIGEAEPTHWTTRGSLYREKFPASSMIDAIAICMAAAANGEKPWLSAPTITRAPVPSTGHPAIAMRPATPSHAPAQRPRAPAMPSPFGSTGKGWCEQCESLRSREYAAACTSRFCKLRPHT